MKNLKMAAYFILTAFLLLSVTACDDDDDPVSPAGNPTITKINPPNGEVKDIITITGTNFGKADDNGTVSFNGTEAKGEVGATDSDYISWIDTKIEVRVPVGATTGDLFVKNGTKTSNKMTFTVGAIPATIAGLKAVSIDATTIGLMWDASADKSKAGFKYVVTYKVAGKDEKKELTEEKIRIESLEAGTEVEFTVKGMFDNGNMSVASMIKWASANRYNDLDGAAIRMFESASVDFGSGLDFYDDTKKTPMNNKVANGDKWNIGVKMEGTKINFGSANLLTYDFKGKTPLNPAEITDPMMLDNLDEGYNAEGLDKMTYAKKLVDIATLDKSKSYVFYARVQEAGTKYNYARIQLVSKGGEFLQGTAPNRFVEVKVSYQTVAGVPYAKTALK